MKIFIIPFFLAVLSLSSCSIFDNAGSNKELAEQYRLQRDDCENKLEFAYLKIKDDQQTITDLERLNKKIAGDTINTNIRYQKCVELNTDLNEMYDKLLDQHRLLLTQSSSAAAEYTTDLSEKERQLSQKEFVLNELSTELNDRRNELDFLKSELEEREKKVAELEAAIESQAQKVRDLKLKVAGALNKYIGNGLEVEVRNNKVYVSMSDKLLFASGSTVVNEEGIQALSTIAKAISNDQSISIWVEGHTDNVQFNAPVGAITDNWDLSVIRATSVVRKLMINGVQPDKLVASGLGEHSPIATNTTSEGRAKNRRTEIVLAPKFNELFQLID